MVTGLGCLRVVADGDRVTHQSLADAHETAVLLHREGAESHPGQVFEQVGHGVRRQDDLVVGGRDRGRSLVALAGVNDLGRDAVDVECADVGGVT
jgi:hypothetical protein